MASKTLNYELYFPLMVASSCIFPWALIAVSMDSYGLEDRLLRSGNFIFRGIANYATFLPIWLAGIRSAASTYRTHAGASTGQKRAISTAPIASSFHCTSHSSKGKRPSAVHLPAWQLPSISRRRPLRCAVGRWRGRAGNAGRPPEVTGDPLRGFSRGTHTSPMRSLACSDQQGVFSGSQRTVRRAHRN